MFGLYDIFDKVAAYEGLEDILLIFLIFFSFVSITLLVLYLLLVVGKWKVFTKAGISGWKSVIPIYNKYLFCQICGLNTIWVWFILGSAIVSILVPPLAFCYSLVSIYFLILQTLSLAKSFGRSDVFAIGLIFAAPIFYLILGSGKSNYNGPMPIRDYVLETLGVNEKKIKEEVFSEDVVSEGNDSSVNGLNEKKFCSACGSKLENSSSFCSYCGHKI